MSRERTDLEQLQDAQQEIATLREQLAQAQSQAQRNYADLTAAREQVTTLTADRDARLAERDALAIERDAAVSAIAGNETRIEAEVTRRLADAGVEPIRHDPAASVEGADPAAAVNAIAARYADLAETDPEAAFQFYLENKHALLTASSLAA